MSKKRRKTARPTHEKVTLDSLSTKFFNQGAAPPGSIDADEITRTTNVISGRQFIARQENTTILLPDDGKIPMISRATVNHRAKSSAKSSPFYPPGRDDPFFTGRDEELKRLEHLLLAGNGSRTTSIVGLYGTGGMGKSTLASRFAYHYRDQFPDGVIGRRVDGNQVINIARDFALLADGEIDVKKDLSATAIMQHAFQDKQALLIFDNADDISVRELIPFDSPCSIIITTRDSSLLRSFGVKAEDQINLQRLNFDKSKSLLYHFLGEQRVEAEKKAVEEIYELIGGLPLALRIIGGTLQDQSFTSVTEYAVSLKDEKQRLSYLFDPGNPDLDVRASFELSLKFLKEEQITLFATLGACSPEGFDLQTAQIVSEQDERLVRIGMGRLISLSLVENGTEPGLFVLHPLLFLFSRELAQKKGLLTIAEARHTEYFFQYAQNHRGGSLEHMDALEKEINALLLTAGRLTGNLKAANEYYTALEPFLETRGYWYQALEIIETYLYIARAKRDHYRTAQFLLQKGQFRQLQTRLAEAEQIVLEGQEFALQIDDYWQRQRTLSMLLSLLGVIYQHEGKLPAAQEVFKRSLAIAQKMGDPHSQAIVLNSLGEVYERQGKHELAEQAFEQSIELGQDKKKHLPMVLNSRGGEYLDRGQIDEAIKLFQESYELRVRSADLRGRAISLNSLGKAYLRKGLVKEAIDFYQQSYKMLVELKDLPGQAMVLHSLGSLYRRRGELNQALEALQQSYDLRVELNNEIECAKVLNTMGHTYLGHNLPTRALEKFIGCFEINEKMHEVRELRMLTGIIVRICKQLHRLDEAQDYCQRALAVAPDDKELLNLQRKLVRNPN